MAIRQPDAGGKEEMTDYSLTEDQRRLLAEKLLDEVFRPGMIGFPYKHDGITYSNRTFTTPDDADKVMLALGWKKGWWNDFEEYCEDQWRNLRTTYRGIRHEDH